MKTCYRCKEEKQLSAFYPSKTHASGYQNKCGECCRAEWRERYQKPETKERIRKYRATPKSRAYQAEYRKVHKLRFKDRYLARKTVYNHIKAGRMVPQPCEICGEKAHAHHDDYSKPLEVRWLCSAHHGELHRVRELTYEPMESSDGV